MHCAKSKSLSHSSTSPDVLKYGLSDEYIDTRSGVESKPYSSHTDPSASAVHMRPSPTDASPFT